MPSDVSCAPYNEEKVSKQKMTMYNVDNTNPEYLNYILVRLTRGSLIVHSNRRLIRQSADCLSNLRIRRIRRQSADCLDSQSARNLFIPFPALRLFLDAYEPSNIPTLLCRREITVSKHQNCRLMGRPSYM